ncbi:MAG: penicillin acylase family protein [Planctomycetota bacterium]
MFFSRFLSYWFCRYFSPYHASLYSGQETLAGLSAEVQCSFNEKGIPTLMASNEEDLFFVQGYLHARERLWLMELSRATFRGELAELLGEIPLEPPAVSHQLQSYTTVDLDRFIRTFGLYESGKKAPPLLSETFCSKLDAYLLGVNTHIQQIQKNPHLAPLEIRLLKRKVKPWTREDSCCIEKLFAFQLNYSWRSLLVLHLIEAHLGTKQDELKFRYPAHHPPLTQTKSVADFLRLEESIRNFTSLAGKSLGSNAWVLSGKKTASGKPLLANDPHLSLQIPAVWYFVSLKAPHFQGTGASIPGTPGILIGHNEHLAWGFTNAMADDADLYEEELNSEKTHYRQGEEWRPLTFREEILEIRDQEPRKVIIRSTERGPLISDCFSHTDLPLSFRWTMHDTSTHIENFYHAVRAKNKEELLDAVKKFVAPAQNLIYADIQGNIGYHYLGKIPIRPGDRDLRIQKGSESSQWKGYIPFQELPSLENPDSGILVTANQKIEDEHYPYYISHFYEPAFRANRIYSRLQEHNDWTPEQIERVFLDVHCLQAEQFLQRHLACLSRSTDFEEQAIRYLKEWDFKMTAESIGASLFNVWYLKALKLFLEPLLGTTLFGFYVEILHQAVTPFETILSGTTLFASQEEVRLKLQESFKQSLQELQKMLGPEIDQWKWGKIHRLPLEHLFGSNPLLGPRLNIGPIPGAGGSMTVNNGTFSLAKPFTQLLGASCRFLADLSQLDHSGFSLPGGQSGHWNSPHYQDQLSDWILGKLTTPASSTKKRKTFLPKKP